MSKQQTNQVQIIDRDNNSLLAKNKKTITEDVQDIKDLVVNGDYDALKALIYAVKLKEIADQLEKAIRPIATEKTKLAKGETYTSYDVEVGSKQVGVEYDFTVCNDPIWVELSNKTDEYKKALKERETFLKTITKKIVIVTDDGEPIEINPPVKKYSDGLSLKIK